MQWKGRQHTAKDCRNKNFALEAAYAVQTRRWISNKEWVLENFILHNTKNAQALGKSMACAFFHNCSYNYRSYRSTLCSKRTGKVKVTSKKQASYIKMKTESCDISQFCWMSLLRWTYRRLSKYYCPCFSHRFCYMLTSICKPYLVRLGILRQVSRCSQPSFPLLGLW